MNEKSTVVSTTSDRGSNGSDAHQSISKALTRNKDRLLIDLKTVIEDAQALLKEAAESSTENIANVPAYLENRFDMVKGNLHRARAVIEQKAKYGADITDQYVKQNPWKSMGYVTAASLLLGALLASVWSPLFGRSGRAGK